MIQASDFSDQDYEKYNDYFDNGDDLMDQDNFIEAEKVFLKALSHVPEPHSEWEEATNAIVGVGDAQYFQDKFSEALDSFEKAKLCPDGIGNPFVHLRLGQCKFELGKLDAAADELMRAYMAAGYDVFEEEDKKYIDFLKTKATLD